VSFHIYNALLFFETFMSVAAELLYKEYKTKTVIRNNTFSGLSFYSKFLANYQSLQNERSVV